MDVQDDANNAHVNAHLRAKVNLGYGLTLQAFGSFSYNNIHSGHYYPTYVTGDGEAHRREMKNEELFHQRLVKQVLQQYLARITQIVAPEFHGPTPLLGEQCADVEVNLPRTIRLQAVNHRTYCQVLDVLGRHKARRLALLVNSNLNDQSCGNLFV
jgi:hypothetical protein